jgi:GT2 family glycosyltransferase
VVANLPYYITSAVLRHILEAKVRPTLAVVMVQKEVAERIVALPGGMSLLAVSVQFYAEPRIMDRVPAGAFRPQPKVDSAVLRLDIRPQPAVTDVPPETFFRVVRAGFSQKRKQLQNTLSAGLRLPKAVVRDALTRAGIDPTRRAETLSLDEWGALCRSWRGYGGLPAQGPTHPPKHAAMPNDATTVQIESAPPAVAVIILNWNGCGHLAACLPALYAQTYQNFETIVVDNGSTDGSQEWLREHYPQVQLMENPTNRGFAAANNQAIRTTRAEYIVLLNNDTVAESGWLEALVAAAESDPTIGMVASKMLLASSPGIIDSAGIAIDRAGIAWGREGGQPDRPAATGAPVEVFGASGGAALYRRALLEDIGPFDEAFFAYLEDVDLAWRAQWAGWRCVYAPDAVVWHHHSATGNRIPHFKSRLLGRNKVWLLAKNYPFPHILWHLPLIFLYELMSLVYAARERRLGSALTGRLAGLRRLPAVIAQRRTQVRRIGADAMLAKLQPVEPPWRVLRRFVHVPLASRLKSEDSTAPH